MKVLKIASALVAMAGLAVLGRIGASVRDLEPAEADRQKLTGGAVVEEVQPDSPAARAGLRRSDVIVAFDGEPVRSVRQFSRLVQETPSGRAVKATIVRDGQRSDIQLTPAEDRRADVFIDGDRVRERLGDFVARIPDLDFNIDIDPMGMGRGRLGVTVSPLGGQLAAYFGAKEGVLLTAVTEGSPAERAGLKAGDDAEMTVGIVRDKKETSVKARLESRMPRSARPI